MPRMFKVNSLIFLPYLFPELLYFGWSLTSSGFATDWVIQLVLCFPLKLFCLWGVLERFRYYRSHSWALKPLFGRRNRRVFYLSFPAALLLLLPTVILLGTIIIGWDFYRENPSLVFNSYFIGELLWLGVLVLVRRIFKVRLWSWHEV